MYIRYALAQGMSVREIAQMTNIDPWFLHQLKEISDVQAKLGTEPNRCRPLARDQAHGLLRRAPGLKRWINEERPCGGRKVHQLRKAAQRPPGVQARRHLRRRVRKLHAVSLLHLRRRRRGHAHRSQESHHPGQRAQPHRAGNRVRLLLLPCGLRAARRRLRDDHDQLQSRDRLHRLRHQRSSLLRAAHLRRRDGGLRARSVRRRGRSA